MAHINATLQEILSRNAKLPQNPQIKLSFNEILIKATYHNNYDLVKELIHMDEFNKSFIYDIGLLNTPFPLYYITMCFKRVMWLDFREEYKPFVEMQRINIDKLLKLWHDEFDVDTTSPIDYKKYKDFFFSAWDEDTIDDVLMNPVQDYLDNNCREIDLKLFEAVDKFHFEEVKRLLEMGANPDAELTTSKEPDPEDYWNCFNRIGTECSFLCTCEIWPLITENQDVWYLKNPLDSREIGDLVGWAAHEEMYALLLKYDKTGTHK